MNKKLIWTILFLLVIGGTIFFFLRKPKEEVEVDTEKEKEEIVLDREIEDVEEDKEYEYTGSTDFSLFSTKDQTLGAKSDSLFEIQSYSEKSSDGYHEISFTLKSSKEDEPFVTGKYLSSLGVIRLDFQGISKDSTGIGYQQEKKIEKEGVLRIYHNVSAQSDQELYDIGVSKSTSFRLYSESMEDGLWKVILNVKYPGESDSNVDLGSSEYSKEDQSIKGSDTANITSYSYGSGGGMLKLVWSVSSVSGSPIPSVSGGYNESNELVVVFENLVMDRVANFSSEMSLSSGIKAVAVREGMKTTYTFSGIGSKRDFRLSSSLSPNQVVLEIK